MMHRNVKRISPTYSNGPSDVQNADKTNNYQSQHLPVATLIFCHTYYHSALTATFKTVNTSIFTPRALRSKRSKEEYMRSV